jgi:t-SNARE complex subunit (syntaxin)|tara:strand:- start:2061 stop:2417 length:357 start_codon:yes stop_codon:yes gene_type:complete
MTQREVLESVLAELKHIKTNMPNGEMKVILKEMKEIKEDFSEMKYLLLNPEDGVVVKTNKNTDFRTGMQEGQRDFNDQMAEVQELKRWKQGVNKALWIIFGSIVVIVIRILMMHSEKL